MGSGHTMKDDSYTSVSVWFDSNSCEGEYGYRLHDKIISLFDEVGIAHEKNISFEVGYVQFRLSYWFGDRERGKYKAHKKIVKWVKKFGGSVTLNPHDISCSVQVNDMAKANKSKSKTEKAFINAFSATNSIIYTGGYKQVTIDLFEASVSSVSGRCVMDTTERRHNDVCEVLYKFRSLHEAMDVCLKDYNLIGAACEILSLMVEYLEGCIDYRKSQ